MCQEGKAFLVIIFNDYYSLFHLKKKSLVVGPYEPPNKVQFIQRSPQLGIIRLAITASKLISKHTLSSPSGWSHSLNRKSTQQLLQRFCSTSNHLSPTIFYWNGTQPSTTIFSTKHSLSLQIHITHFLLGILIIAFSLFNFWSFPCHTTYMAHNILFGGNIS